MEAQINLTIANYKNLLISATKQQEINEVINNGKAVSYNHNGKQFVLIHIDSNDLFEFYEGKPELHETNYIEIIGCQFCQLREECLNQQGNKSPINNLPFLCDLKQSIIENHNEFIYEECYVPIFVDIATIL